MVVCVGNDEARVRAPCPGDRASWDQLRSGGVGGTPEEARDFLGRLGALGVTRTCLQFLDLGDHEHLRLVAADVAGT